MFTMPRIVIKSGEVIVEEGHLRKDQTGKTFYVSPGYDEALVPEIKDWFESYYTIQFANYPVDDHYLPEGECVRSE